MAKLRILIADWNDRDKVLVVDREKAMTILRDGAKLPKDRMTALYDLAVEAKGVKHDPRASQMENTTFFLPWPGAWYSDENWLRDLAEAEGALAEEDEAEAS